MDRDQVLGLSVSLRDLNSDPEPAVSFTRGVRSHVRFREVEGSGLELRCVKSFILQRSVYTLPGCQDTIPPTMCSAFLNFLFYSVSFVFLKMPFVARCIDFPSP